MPGFVVCLLLSVTVLFSFLFFRMSNIRAEGRSKMNKTGEN